MGVTFLYPWRKKKKPFKVVEWSARGSCGFLFNTYLKKTLPERTSFVLQPGQCWAFYCPALPRSDGTSWGDFLLPEAKMETDHHDHPCRTESFPPTTSHSVGLSLLFNIQARGFGICSTKRQKEKLIFFWTEFTVFTDPFYLHPSLHGETKVGVWHHMNLQNIFFICWAVDLFAARNLHLIDLSSLCRSPNQWLSVTRIIQPASNRTANGTGSEAAIRV